MATLRQRQIIEGPYGELLIAPDTGGRSAPHFHTSFAIGVSWSGSGSLFARGHNWTYSAEMVVVTNPYDPHWGRPGPGGVGYSLLYPSLAWLSSLDGLGEPKHFEMAVIDSPPLAARLGAAFDAVADSGEECLLRAAIGELFHRHAGLPAPAAPAIGSAASDRIAGAAHQAGFSRSYYTRRFRKLTGLSPLDHRRQSRVMAARSLIEAGAELAEAAADAGFADQAHMSRQFRQILGVTPAAYRPAG
jgi:AraC-like DNA-binding protein